MEYYLVTLKGPVSRRFSDIMESNRLIPEQYKAILNRDGELVDWSINFSSLAEKLYWESNSEETPLVLRGKPTNFVEYNGKTFSVRPIDPRTLVRFRQSYRKYDNLMQRLR